MSCSCVCSCSWRPAKLEKCVMFISDTADSMVMVPVDQLVVHCTAPPNVDEAVLGALRVENPLLSDTSQSRPATGGSTNLIGCLFHGATKEVMLSPQMSRDTTQMMLAIRVQTGRIRLLCLLSAGHIESVSAMRRAVQKRTIFFRTIEFGRMCGKDTRSNRRAPLCAPCGW